MPYGQYDAFSDNFFDKFLKVMGAKAKKTKWPDAEKESYKQAIEMSQSNAKEGIAPQFDFEQTQTPGGKNALRMTEDSTKLYNMLGGETSVRGYEARAAQKMKKLDFNQRMMVFDKTEKAFEYLKKLESQEGISPDAKKAVRNLFIDGAGKVGIDLSAYKNANISELEEGWKTGQTNKLSELFNTWQKDPTPQNESFFVSALSKTGKAVDRDVWKTAYSTEKAKVDKRPYKVGQILPAERNGNVFETKQVTGYDDKNMPIFKTIAKSPIREGEEGRAMAKQGAIKEVGKVLAEKYLPLAKGNISDPEAAKSLVQGIFTTDQFGMNVNTARLRDSLNEQQRGSYDWVKMKAENYANKYSPSTAVDMAIKDYHKEFKTSFKTPPVQPSQGKKIKGYNYVNGKLEPVYE